MSRTRFVGTAAQAAALVAGAVLATGAIAACGGSSSGKGAGSEPARQVMSRVQRAVAAARSVHMVGKMKEGSSTVSIDASFAGHEMAGTIGENGATFDVLALGSQAYIKINPAFIRQAQLPASACSAFCGRYAQLPAASVRQLTGNLSMSELASQAFSSRLVTSAKQPGARFVPARVAGRPVLQYSKAGYTLDVARSGPAYPVLYTGPDGDRITFSDWNSVRLPGPPPASQVVNLSQL